MGLKDADFSDAPDDLSPIDRILWPRFDWESYLETEFNSVVQDWNLYSEAERRLLASPVNEEDHYFYWMPPVDEKKLPVIFVSVSERKMQRLVDHWNRLSQRRAGGQAD